MKALEPVIERHVDAFVRQIGRLGSGMKGLVVPEVCSDCFNLMLCEIYRKADPGSSGQTSSFMISQNQSSMEKSLAMFRAVTIPITDRMRILTYTTQARCLRNSVQRGR